MPDATRDKPFDKPVYKWMVQREFWYDIAKTVISAYLIALIAVTFAAIGGLRFDPYSAGLLIYLMVLVLFIFGMAFALPFVFMRARKSYAHGPTIRYLYLATLGMLVFAIGVCLYLLVTFNQDFG